MTDMAPPVDFAAVLRARRAELATTLEQLMAEAQRMRDALERCQIQAERIRGALALCDELLAAAPPELAPLDAAPS